MKRDHGTSQFRRSAYAQLAMNVHRAIVKPYIGICKHLSVYSTICRYIFGFRFVLEDISTTRPCRPKARDCGPREFPQPLARPPDAAGALDCRAQLALVPAECEPSAGAIRILALSYGLTPESRIESPFFRILPRRFPCRGF